MQQFKKKKYPLQLIITTIVLMISIGLLSYYSSNEQLQKIERARQEEIGLKMIRQVFSLFQSITKFRDYVLAYSVTKVDKAYKIGVQEKKNCLKKLDTMLPLASANKKNKTYYKDLKGFRDYLNSCEVRISIRSTTTFYYYDEITQRCMQLFSGVAISSELLRDPEAKNTILIRMLIDHLPKIQNVLGMNRGFGGMAVESQYISSKLYNHLENTVIQLDMNYEILNKAFNELIAIDPQIRQQFEPPLQDLLQTIQEIKSFLEDKVIEANPISISTDTYFSEMDRYNEKIMKAIDAVIPIIEKNIQEQIFDLYIDILKLFIGISCLSLLFMSVVFIVKTEGDKQTAVAASHSKSQFLAGMSHEIRTPMNAIIGMADLLWESKLDYDQKNFVSIIRDASDDLLNLINDILDLAKVESGQLELEETDFDLLSIVEKVCEVLAVGAHQKKIEMICQVHPKTPVYLSGDPTRLHQILTNLIGNAIKFTEEGEIYVACKQSGNIYEDKDKNGQKVEILFSVRDTGIGIPENVQTKIFENFKQVDSSTTRKYGGTGLGLAICKQLVEMMGGRIWVESGPEGGSIFHFTSHFHIQKRLEFEEQSSPPYSKKLNVLIVDDNKTSRLTLEQTLSDWGIDVRLCRSGIDALEIISRNERDGKTFDIILIDGSMPEMDGFTLISRLKQEYRHLSKRMVLLTPDDKAKNGIAENLGIAAKLRKPIKRHRLEETIAMISGENLPTTELHAESDNTTEKQKEIKPIRILLVEDNPVNQSLFILNLKNTPHKVDIAVNGKQGVEKFMSDKYEMVFMDKEMPEMDGNEATRKIREWEKGNNRLAVPIIALTADAMKGTEEESKAAGCTGYMTKPFKKKELLEVIAQCAD